MTEGSAIRRIGHVRWLRNVAIAIGNALRSEVALPEQEQQALHRSLQHWSAHTSLVVSESVAWALAGDQPITSAN